MTNQGVLPDHEIKQLLTTGVITTPEAIDYEKRIQPASLDLSLSGEAYRIGRRTSLLPVLERIKRGRAIDLTQPQQLEADVVYLIKLNEAVRFSHDLRAYANPKSTTGRDDLFTRLLTEDKHPSYDCISTHYQGNLWVEVVPNSFPVILSKNVSLNQLRLFRGRTECDENTLRGIHDLEPLLFSREGQPLQEKDIVIQDLGTGKPGLIMNLELK